MCVCASCEVGGAIALLHFRSVVTATSDAELQVWSSDTQTNGGTCCEVVGVKWSTDLMQICCVRIMDSN